jgi:arabinogalactan oligomer / maltooligosaccharide transport system substrate-binding protein
MLAISRRKAIAGLVAGLAVAGMAAVPSAQAVAAKKVITVWSDSNRAPAVKALFSAGFQGAKVNVVVVGFGDIRDNLKTVKADAAPDVIIGAHDWTGELAANGSIVPLTLSQATRNAIPGYALDAFSYNGNAYGMPTQLENVALVRNTTLVPDAPTTFAQLKAMSKTVCDTGLALSTGKKADAGKAIPGCARIDWPMNGYHEYPLLSGLGGGAFKRTNGTDDPNNVIYNSPAVQANIGIVQGWQADSSFLNKGDEDYGYAKFFAKKSPFMVTGPWSIGDLKKSKLKIAVSAVPNIAAGINPVPWLGVQGFMVTKFAAGHGVADLANALVSDDSKGVAGQKSQKALAAASLRAPARSDVPVTDAYILGFGAAGVGGISMPNIPQVGCYWNSGGNAWSSMFNASIADRVPAATAFAKAQTDIENCVKG